MDPQEYKLGDVIECKETNKEMIYDGTRLIDLEYKYSDYGHVPTTSKRFQYPNFPIGYWDNVIESSIRVVPSEYLLFKEVVVYIDGPIKKTFYIYELETYTIISCSYISKEIDLVIASRSDELANFYIVYPVLYNVSQFLNYS